MQITLNVNVLVKDGALVLTDRTGKTVTFSKEQTVQQKVSMIALGELCNLPKRQLATCLGFKTRKSYYDIRNAVLNGSLADLLPASVGREWRYWMRRSDSAMTLGELCNLPKRQLATCLGFKTRKSSYDIRNAVLNGSLADLLPTRPAPRTLPTRTKEVEACIIRTRFETDRNRYEIAEALTHMGFNISARLVGQVLADYGLAKKNGVHRRPSQRGSSPKRRSKSSMAPASRAHASSRATPSIVTSPPSSHAG